MSPFIDFELSLDANWPDPANDPWDDDCQQDLPALPNCHVCNWPAGFCQDCAEYDAKQFEAWQAEREALRSELHP